MRFVGLVLVLVGLTAGYFLGYQGLTIDQARARLAQLLNLPGLAPPATLQGTLRDKRGIPQAPDPGPIGAQIAGAAQRVRA